MPRRIKFLNCYIDLSKKVFEPRIETEFWVGKVIEEIRSLKFEIRNLEMLDIFAGSGCIGIAVLKACPELCRRMDFVDIDKKALQQIKINLKLNKVPPKRYGIYHSNLFEKLKEHKYNIIFANPPYVALDRISEVDEEVLKIDPWQALFAGKDGMFWIKNFLKEVKSHLKPGGIFYLEFDPPQKEEIEKIFKKDGFKFSFRKDQFLKYRWLKAKK